MYLAPLDAIWPPLILMVLATVIGLISAWFDITYFVVLAVIGFAILIGDCLGRSRDYLNARRRFDVARDEIEVYEVVRRFRRAWCARVACEAAWKRAGVNEAGKSELGARYVRATYHMLGYRYWHIFPDGTFTKNSPFLKLAFWIHLFTGKMKRDEEENSKPAMEPAE